MSKWRKLVVLIITFTVAIILFGDNLNSLVRVNIEYVDITLKDKPKQAVLALTIPHASTNGVSETEQKICETIEFIENDNLTISGETSHKKSKSKSSFDFGSNEFVINENRNKTNVYNLIRRIHHKIRIIEPTVKLLVFSCNETSVDGNEDLLCMDPPTFLPNYKNPCWYTETHAFRCLPYFQLIGMGKCGSSDLFGRIVQHPDVLENKGHRHKETWWWSWRRYGLDFHKTSRRESLEQYLSYFRSDQIQMSPRKDLITGDGTPMDLSDNSGWPSIPQNNGLAEPKYMTPHLIKHLNPDVKLIVIVRDPVERLFSDYFFHGIGNMTTEAFHQQVIYSVGLLHNCTCKFTLRACLYDRDLINSYTARLHVGFYAIFLQDWFQVFPREQFHIIKTEEYSLSVAEHIHQIYEFLDLRGLPLSAMKTIANSDRKFETERKKTAGDMKQETREILRELYRPFNQLLATMLNDARFMWYM